MILVPPNPGRRTIQLRVGTRAVRLVSIALLGVIATLGLWAAGDLSTAALTADRLASAQQLILALSDSMRALRAQSAQAVNTDYLPGMIMPVAGAQLTSRFSASRFHPLLQIFRPHRGIDLSAPVGTRIVAPASATVRFVGWRFGDGLTVELAHDGGVVTRYAHCRSALVHVGQHIAAGEAIAAVGMTGLATGPHVHFEVLLRGKAVDPLRYLAASTAAAAPGLQDR